MKYIYIKMGNKIFYDGRLLYQGESFNDTWLECQKIRRYLEIALNNEITVLTQGGTWILDEK